MLLAIFTSSAAANFAIWVIIVFARIGLVVLFIRVSGVPVPQWAWQALGIVCAAIFFIILIIFLVSFAGQPGPMFGH